MASPKCDFSQLKGVLSKPRAPNVNEALVHFESSEYWTWAGWTAECYNCELAELPETVPGWEESGACSLVSTKFPYHFEARSSVSGAVIKHTVSLGQRGHYAVAVRGSNSIEVTTTKDPLAQTEIWGPLVTMVAVILCGFLARGLCRENATSENDREEKVVHPLQLKPSRGSDLGTGGDNWYMPLNDTGGVDEGWYKPPSSSNSNSKAAAESTGSPKKTGGSSRLNSLDTFRGLSLTCMVFVNYGGGGYWWLDHSSWNGLTVADLLFPWFMWIMGVSMALALKSRSASKKTASRSTMLQQIARRSAALFSIGLFLDCPGSLGQWRIPGVLQYFAVSYAWCCLAVVLTGSWDGEPGAAAQEALEGNDPGDTFRELRFFWREWPAVLLAPGLWLLLSFAVEVPGCGKGYLGPGGRSIEGGHGYAQCTGGSHRYIDLKVFGHQHIYDEPTCVAAYQCHTPYDPEGLVGSFNAVLLTYMGIMAGRVLIYHKGAIARVKRLGMMGAVATLVAALLCNFSKEGGAIPVNKNLWSTSFVLVTAGFGYWVLALLYVVVDELQWWDGAPFRYTGMNSIVVYVGSEVLEGYFPFYFSYSHYSHWAHLAANAMGAGMWNAVATYLYHKGVFIKV